MSRGLKNNEISVAFHAVCQHSYQTPARLKNLDRGQKFMVGLRWRGRETQRELIEVPLMVWWVISVILEREKV